MAKINFDIPHHCQRCKSEMIVNMPVWLRPGNDFEFSDIDYESSNPQSSNNWFCETCDDFTGFPIEMNGGEK